MLAFDLLRKSMPCIIKLRGNGCCYGSNDFVGLTYSNKIKKIAIHKLDPIDCRRRCRLIPYYLLLQNRIREDVYGVSVRYKERIWMLEAAAKRAVSVMREPCIPFDKRPKCSAPFVVRPYST